MSRQKAAIVAKKRVGAGARKTAKPPAEGYAEHTPAWARGDHAAPPEPFPLTDGFVELTLRTGEGRELLGRAILPGVEMEGRCLPATLADLPHVRTTSLFGRQATWHAGRDAFRSGDFDIVRYGAHAFFEPVHRRHSGIVCQDNTVFCGSRLADLEPLPELMFFNARETARVSPSRPLSCARDGLGRLGQLHPLREPPLRGCKVLGLASSRPQFIQCFRVSHTEPVSFFLQLKLAKRVTVPMPGKVVTRLLWRSPELECPKKWPSRPATPISDVPAH